LATVIFLTMCVKKRRPLLARAEIVALLLDCWREADHWLVGRWVAMPDHLHLFCAPAMAPATPVASWTRPGASSQCLASAILAIVKTITDEESE
jgi:putative transposase